MNIKELAAKLNLSVTTTSRALNGHSSVSQKTKERVLAAANQYGYMPNRQARSLKSGKTGVIGMVFPVYNTHHVPSFLSEFIISLAEALDVYGYSLVVNTSKHGLQNTKSWQAMVANKQVDAMILPRLEINDLRISWLQAKNMPFVAFGHPDEPANFPWLDLDNFEAFHHIVHHLYDQGHRDIALLAGNPRLLLTQQRVRGFLAAIDALGLPQKSYHVRHYSMSELGGQQGFSMLHAQAKIPTAIVCSNDSQAFGVMSMADQRGLKIGKDLAVTGYDDLSWSAYWQPALTTFHQPVSAIARRLAEMTAAHLGGENIKNLQELWKARLIVRQSCQFHKQI